MAVYEILTPYRLDMTPIHRKTANTDKDSEFDGMQQHGELQDTNVRDIFLSHRSPDKSIVWEFAADIEVHAWQGRSLMTWVDEAEIRPGQSVVGMVNNGLERSRFIGLVLTPAYFQSASRWADAEWHAALYADPDNRAPFKQMQK